jgi:serine/threonine protein kinase
MSLPSGARLGPYQIVAPLGAGGMGEVYRARDAKLDRDVAINVLPAQTAGDPGALARFEHEAKAVAALSHPNILAIFDFGHDHGTAYAVTELLDGETLREKLGQAAAPPRKAIEYAVQIARGLAAAQEKGIVHRDLKPKNLFVTASGQVKILDFGLARRGNVQPAGAETMSPTIGRLTDPGTVLGTVGYMSPEQVRGEAGDHRSDIFSFGAVLYELVTGRRAFQRDTPAETMTAILRDEPPSLTEQVSSTVPPAVGHIVHHCLEKSPSERFQSASDIAFALQALSGSSSSREQSLATLPARSRRGFWALTVVVAAAIAAAGVVAGRLSVTAPAVVSFAPLTYLDQMIFRGLFAPNADTIVFSASLNGNMDDVEIFTISKEYPEPRSLGSRTRSCCRSLPPANWRYSPTPVGSRIVSSTARWHALPAAAARPARFWNTFATPTGHPMASGSPSSATSAVATGSNFRLAPCWSRPPGI